MLCISLPARRSDVFLSDVFLSDVFRSDVFRSDVLRSDVFLSDVFRTVIENVELASLSLDLPSNPRGSRRVSCV